MIGLSSLRSGKKGQVMLFVIVAIVILLIGVSIYFITSSQKQDISEDELIELRSISENIKLFVDSCLEDVSIPGIFLLGSQGGFIYTYDNILITEDSSIAYHYDYGDKVGPNRDYMEKELSTYIRNTLDVCINEFNDYKELGVEFELGENVVRSTINENDIKIEINYPITIKKDKSQIIISKFNIRHPFRFGHLLNIKDQIISKLNNNDMIDLNELADYSANVAISLYDNETFIYYLNDKESEFENNYLPFFFAVKDEANSAPKIDFIPDFVLGQNKLFTYKVDAIDLDNDDLTFYSTNNKININSVSGEISFTPLELGEIETNICVTDKIKEDCEVVKFKVEI
ncbi:hypothetical protein ACFL1H_00555 [Nanoarchaeota archaeon]